MNLRELELTEQQAEIFDEVMAKIDEAAAFLVGLSHEELRDWLEEHQHRRPISFEREIGGTFYTVSAHFRDKAAETVEVRVTRVLARDAAH